METKFLFLFLLFHLYFNLVSTNTYNHCIYYFLLIIVDKEVVKLRTLSILSITVSARQCMLRSTSMSVWLAPEETKEKCVTCWEMF